MIPGREYEIEVDEIQLEVKDGRAIFQTYKQNYTQCVGSSRLSNQMNTSKYKQRLKRTRDIN